MAVLLKTGEEMDIHKMENQRQKLEELIDSQFGLLEKLLKKQAITHNHWEQIKNEQTRNKMNKMMLDYIFQMNKHGDLIAALSESSQSHVVNWIKSGGEYNKEFGFDWSLTESQHTILDANLEELINTIDNCELTSMLYSEQVINSRQRNVLCSKTTDHEKNEALLGMVRRLSQKSFQTLINCLMKSNQGHIADILQNGGVIVPVHATLETDNLNETEAQIVDEMANLLLQRNTSPEQAQHLLAATQLKIIAVKRGRNILLYTCCSNEDELNRLCTTIDNSEIKEFLEELFNLIIRNSRIKIQSMKIFETDQANAMQFFKRSTMCLESSIIAFGKDYSISKAEIGAFKINLNRPDEVSVLQQLPAEVDSFMAAAFYCGSVFITGTGENKNEIWRFDAKYSKWNKCAPMMKGRYDHSVAFVDHILYICGGQRSNQVFDDVEAYDAIDDKCSSVGKLTHAVREAENCVHYKASLYIFGGENAYGQIMNSVQVYNTKLNSCTALTNPMPRNKAHLYAALFKQYVILLGEESCFLYNFDTETWEVRDQFKTDVKWFGMTVHNEQLFVIGGRDSNYPEEIRRDDVRYVPIVNLLNDEPIEWKHHAKLPKPFAVHTYARIEILVKQI